MLQAAQTARRCVYCSALQRVAACCGVFQMDTHCETLRLQYIYVCRYTYTYKYIWMYRALFCRRYSALLRILGHSLNVAPQQLGVPICFWCLCCGDKALLRRSRTRLQRYTAHLQRFMALLQIPKDKLNSSASSLSCASMLLQQKSCFVADLQGFSVEIWGSFAEMCFSL